MAESRQKHDGYAAACDALNAHTSRTLLIGVIRPNGRTIQRTFTTLGDALDWVVATRGERDVLFCSDRRWGAWDFVSPERFSAIFSGRNADA